MKKNILFWFLALAFGSVVMVSCNKDDEAVHNSPVVGITPVDTIFIAPGETAEYLVDISSTDDLVSVKYTTQVGSNQQIFLDTTFAAGIRSFDQGVNLTIPANIPAGTLGKFSVFASTAYESIIVDRFLIVSNPAVVVVTPADDMLYAVPGGDVAFDMSVTSEDDLISAKIVGIVGGTEYPVFDTTFTAGVNAYNKVITYTIPTVTPVGTVVLVKFSAATAGFNTVVERTIEVIQPLGAYTNIELKAQADGPTTADANLSFYSASTNERFTYNQAGTVAAAQLIDLVFTHHSIFKNGNTNAEMSFQSPNEPNLVTMWNDFPLIPFAYDASNKNQTYFKALTNVDWDNLTYESIGTAVGDIGTLTILRGIDNGDFIGFQTAQGKKGIIKVVSTNPIHNPYNDATITFDVKVQK